VGKAYLKTGVPYFGAAVPIELQDVNEKHLKLENLNRANIMATMKKKLSQLEAINAELMTKLDVKSGYDKIVDFLGEEKFFETEDDLYFVENCIIFHLKKKDMDGDRKSCMDKFCSEVCSSSSTCDIG
jgi:predicted Mrr-cat superfamily restriction endonuclease